MFEIIKSDLGGRIGRLHTNHGTVETPAYVPVIHPVKQSIGCDAIRKMGFEMVITNAYITMKRYGEEAERRGIHDIIGFDGPIMTDSGGYQVLEYGDIDIEPARMAGFETAIMSDVAVPLDKPTGFRLPHDTASSYVDRTLEACRQTLGAAPDNGQIWVGPIQGGEHADLVRRSARGLLEAGHTMVALGSPVEFMESYEYRLLAQMITEARRAVPPRIPMHLFGAGHPLTIPLAVALGCDTFDSASYILYAKQDRYITPDGTRRLSEMRHLPCSCAVCASRTPADIAGDEGRTDLLALHNLAAIKLEVDATKQAIHEGRLWEHVIKKARAHPRLYEATPVLHDNTVLAGGTPRFKAKAAFLYDHTDQYRPEAVALRRAAASFRTAKPVLRILPEPEAKPAYLSGACRAASEDPGVQVCVYNPFLGVIPLELTDLYPAAHHLSVRGTHEPAAFPTFTISLRDLLANNAFEDIRYDESDRFLAYHIREARARAAAQQK